MGKKVIVIGGGPAGYVAAIRAAQLGADVVLAEESKIGGTCLNAGCIPTKTLLHTAEFYRKAVTNAVPGVTTAGVSLDWDAAQKHKKDVVGQLANGVFALLRHNKVTVLNKKAVILSPRQVRVGDETLPADAVILAPGSVNAPLKLKVAGAKDVLDSAGALALERVPQSMAIVGGGVIGVEFAELFNSLGVKVTIIELAPQLLPAADAEIAEYMKASFESKGVVVFTGAQVMDGRRSAGGIKIDFSTNGKKESITAEKLLAAVGRVPNTSGMGLEDLGVKTTRGAIDTDGHFQTNIPGVYAVGDCNGKSMLAHAAMAQGEIAARHIMGEKPGVNGSLIPACIYTSPEVAYIGQTEENLKAKNMTCKVGRFDLAGNAKSIIENTAGFVKIISDGKLGEILGVHIVGPNATEQIAGAALCMNMEGTVEDVVNTIHAHPTASEAMREAAMAVFGKAIHGL